MSTEFQAAKTSLQQSITVNKAFLSTQDDPGTLAATFADLTTIELAVDEWSQAAISLIVMQEQDPDADPTCQKLKKAAERVSSLIISLRQIIEQAAAAARGS